jgi:uncharacterized protein (DUF58 family)
MGEAERRLAGAPGGARRVALLGSALVAAGLGFASSSLLVPGIALALLAASATAWVSASASAVRVERLPGPERVMEDEPFPLRLRVDRGAVPLPRAELHDRLLERPVGVSARGPAVVSVAVRFPRRGRRVLGTPRLHLWDPLGLCRREIEGRGASGELLVLPRIEEVRRAGGAGGREAGLLDGLDQGGGGSGAETGAVDLELDGLRPHRPGSPASRIHWRTVARSGEMYERRFVAGADAAPLIVVDAGAPDSEEALDRAIRAAASLCLHLARRGGCAILLGDRGTPTLVDPRMRVWADVHARLALVDPGAPAPAPRQARGRVATFWVTGAPAARAGRVSARVMPGSYVVSPLPAARVPVAFTVAGCSAQLALAAARGARASVRAAA